MASAASSPQSFGKCLITENTSFNITAAKAYQHLLRVVTSTQLAIVQKQKLSDMIYFTLFKPRAYNILYNIVLILGFKGFSNISILSL